MIDWIRTGARPTVGAAALLLTLLLPLPVLAQATGATESTDPGAAPPAAAITSALATTADVQEPAPPLTIASPLRPEGGTVWSIFGGLGFNQSIAHSAPGIYVATGGVRWSHLWPARFGGFLRGHPAFAIEVIPVETFVQPNKSTWALGSNLLYEHHFLARGSVLPVWKIGAGFLYANHDLPEGETKHNFSLLTALGVDLLITQRSALFVGYRFHHVSNANTGNINPGINAHTLMFGLSFYR